MVSLMCATVGYVSCIGVSCLAGIACPDPGRPQNGSRVGNDFNVGSFVRYFCDVTYVLVGTSQQICLRSGRWSARRPFCEGGFLPNIVFTDYLGDHTNCYRR